MRGYYMREIIVSEEAQGQTLLRFVRKILPNAPESLIQKLFRKKEIRVNNIKRTRDYIVGSGETVRIYLKDDVFEEMTASGTGAVRQGIEPLDPALTVFENDDVVILNKPAGWLTQSDGSGTVSLNERLVATYGVRPGFRPSTANRLDRNTSGLICAGKTVQGLQELSRIFREGLVEKYYLTVLEGVLSEGFRAKDTLTRGENLVSRIGEEDGARIDTEVEPLQTQGGLTLCRVRIRTGKTHQIRAHLSSLGYPVYGDVKYGAKKRKNCRYLLHCERMIFREECGCGLGGRTLTAPVPASFNVAVRS